MKNDLQADLEPIIGQQAAKWYIHEIEKAQTHYEMMRAFWQKELPAARVLLIDNSPRSTEELKEWHSHLPPAQLQALAATECTTPENESTGQRMAAMFGYQISDPQLVHWHAPFETPVAALDTIDAIILTGSSAMVTDAPHTPWMQRVMAVLQEARTKQIPTFGMCFGHQIMAEAFGGKVDWMTDAQGIQIREMGPVFLHYTQEGQSDQIFGGVHEHDDHEARTAAGAIDEGFWVQSVHAQHVTQQPPNTTILATNDMSAIQALRYDNAPMWSIQNHPEYTAVLYDVFTHNNADQFNEWFDTLSTETKLLLGYNSFEELQQKNLSQDTHHAREVLFANFMHFVAEYRQRS